MSSPYNTDNARVRSVDKQWMVSITKCSCLFDLEEILILLQGMVDGPASKPALRQDTGYMVEKTYLDIAPYLGAFGAYLMPQ